MTLRDYSPIVNILLVDDEPELRETLAELLCCYGHTVITAANGEEALVHLRARTFDVLVTDFNMPFLNGIELIKAAYKEKISLKGIILISGGQSPYQREEFEVFIHEFPHPNPFVFMGKPVNVGDLCEIIKEMEARC